MGTVYEAWQKSLNRLVAIKVLSGSAGLTNKAVARFQLEAQAAAKLHHTNIVPIFAQGEHDGVYFYVMELVEGRGLNEIINELRGPQSTQSLDLTETKLVVGPGAAHPTGDPDDTDARPALSEGDRSSDSVSPSDGRGTVRALSESTAEQFDVIAAQIASAADALSYAHEHGVIHRDIKPHNFICGEDGRLRITDFGLARVLEQPGITMTGEFIGSPLYMSPEQITGGQVRSDHRTDIYSLGATMYEWLTLQPPFPGETREQVISKIITSDTVSPRALLPSIPVDLETICLKALEKSPNRRYGSAAEMAEDLRRFRRKEGIRAKREGSIAHIRKFVARNRPAVLAAGVALAITSILWSAKSHTDNARKQALISEQSEQIRNLEDETRRLTEKFGVAPIERGVFDAAAGLMSEVAGALEESSLLDFDAPPALPVPTAPASPTEALVLKQQDLQTIGRIADELTQSLRRSASKGSRPVVAEGPRAGIADEYFREALQTSTLEEALSLLKLTFENAIDHFDALYFRSILRLRQSQFVEAIEDADFLIMLRDRSPAGYLIRGLAKFARHELESSLADLDQAVRLEPQSIAVWVARGAVRVRRGKYHEGIDDLHVALGLSPGHRGADAERTLAHERIKYAIREMGGVIEREPENEQALISRGDLYFLNGNYEPALKDYQRAIEIGDEPSTHVLRQRFLAKQKLGEAGGGSADAKTSSLLRRPATLSVGATRVDAGRALAALALAAGR